MSLRLQRIAASSLAIGLLAGCGGHAAGFVPAGGAPSLSAILPDAAPPACHGQKSSKKYASDSAKLSTKGGGLCIPAFGGFGGTLSYPGANPSVKMTLISSTTDYNKNLPPLGTGKPIFYLQLAISSGTSFGTNAPAGGGLTSKSLKASSPYTAYGQASAGGISIGLGSCYLIATKGKYGGVISGIGTLLKGKNVPIAAQAVVEIYSGKQSGSKC